MSLRSPRISRRSLLRGALAGGAVAAGFPLASCSSSQASAGPKGTADPTGTAALAPDAANVRVSNDQYGVHVEPSVAVNPRDPRQLLAACQASPTANPEFIATYFSSDAGATWQNGGLPRPPAGVPQNGDDVTVAFDAQGRGYVCATSFASRTDRGVYLWRTDDGGRSFSAPVTLLSGQYCDHPWMAVGAGQTAAERNVYAVWAAGSGSALSFIRSTNGGESFAAPQTILGEDGVSVMSAGPTLAAGPHGLVCAVCDRKSQQVSSGDLVAQVVAVCSTDGGQTFGAPVLLGSESGVISLPGDVLPNGSPAVAIGPGGDALYAAFTRHQPGAVHSDIMVTASFDSGRTWAKARAATPADRVTYFQPNLAVDASGRVALSAFALANGRVDEVLLVSTSREPSFGPPLRVSTAAFNPHSPTATGEKHGAWWIGDYQGIAAGAGVFHLMWNDTRTGKLELFAATVRA